jgi:hypothetical protein
MNALTLPAVVGELVAKWRESANGGSRYSTTPFEDGCTAELRRCADELESTLTALTAEAGKGEERARELLAAEMREHYPSTAERLIDFGLSIESFPLSTEAAVRAITLALSTATPAVEWREIESAPRTGIAVLLWQPWKSGRDCTVIGHYANGWSDRDCEEMQPEPTHWQPLPAPPLAASPRGASAGESDNG